eukprot:4995850-Pyramimonas_sp.AAC.1
MFPTPCARVAARAGGHTSAADVLAPPTRGEWRWDPSHRRSRRSKSSECIERNRVAFWLCPSEPGTDIPN